MRRTANKYHAIKTTVDGITFDSKAEARRFAELKLLEKAGELHALQLQPVLSLRVSGTPIGTYRGDFEYCTCATPTRCHMTERVIEDVKGVRTPLYRWKRNHVEAEYGIQIVEVTR